MVVVHYAKMSQFEIDEGDVFHEGIPGDEAGEDGAYIGEAVVLVETLLEADALLGLYKAEGLRCASWFSLVVPCTIRSMRTFSN